MTFNQEIRKKLMWSSVYGFLLLVGLKSTKEYTIKYMLVMHIFCGRLLSNPFRDGPFDIQGGGRAGIFLKKIVCFPTGAKKIKCLQQS